MLGCHQKSNPDSATSNETAEKPRTAAIAQEQNPLFPADVFLESRTPEAGIISFSLRLEGTKERGESEAPNSWTDFKLLGGSVCKIFPTFIEHRDGYDVWQIELKYVASEESHGTPLAEEVSKEILFDGKSPAVVTEDEHHSIVLRPGTGTNYEQGVGGQHDTLPRRESEIEP
jgi:hypothetical protein